ncbi:hypothetical protein B484DRAFT_450560 [Ochromonadaceae sp. CCMP2298]|nr:hypothetical protein B484DRAFT_450560 [Ochromonadaceae sp. CCMP2298]|eukprot:CAMPEP_0173171072 /NCGR_PEP_ID=MMETSP1141-20130122/1564_1 /TAXON_ID=483371 /ORGANISM="non described non described, Strain CCMP2298" /LENGTH=163 /DNA_ID=CAMNT_0014092985 /DNA_START=132 /DNA_END=623 /DNA_ORIENTATION=+
MERAAKELQEMIYQDQEDQIEVLLDRNPELINMFSDDLIYDVRYNYTPLIWAIFSCASTKVTAMLLKHGADKELQGQSCPYNGRTTETALQVLEMTRESCTPGSSVKAPLMSRPQLTTTASRPQFTRATSSFSRDLAIVYFGRAYSEEWYDGTKKLLAHPEEG